MNVHVDYRASLSVVGTIVKYLSASLLFPLAVAIVYGESLAPFLATIVVAVGGGELLERLRPDPDIGHREGFLMVALTWLAVAVVGTVPYLVEAHGVPPLVEPLAPASTLGNPVNALFESMSGFTTTGATVLGSISFEAHSRSILLWRQLTQWLGGMGIVVLMVAILPELSVGGAQLMEAEAPGPSVQKLTPRIRETAKALWKIYVGFTLLAIAVYYALHLLGLAPNMDFYSAVAHALTTLPTGGFSPEARSIEAFSGAIQWAVTAFMIVAGTNFALYWYALNGESERLLRNREWRSYLFATAVVSALVVVPLYMGWGLAELPTNIPSPVGEIENSLRHGVFQAVSIVTTTGYASMDFNTWSASTKTVLLLAMFLGGSAGSAAGSIKIVRWYVIVRTSRRELFTTVHPEAVAPVRMRDQAIDDDTIRGMFVFTLVFFLIFGISVVVVFFDAVRIGLALSTLEATSAVVATLGNIGPGFGIVGPMNNYLPFSNATKLYMVLLMWIGRLEILSVLVIFTPAYWTD